MSDLKRHLSDVRAHKNSLLQKNKPKKNIIELYNHSKLLSFLLDLQLLL